MLLPRLSGGATRSSTLDPISGRRRQAPEGWRGRRPTRGSRSSRYPSRIRSTPGRDYHQGFPSPAHPLCRRQTAEESRCASPSLVIRLHFSAALLFAVTSVVNWINCTMLKPWGSGRPSARTDDSNGPKTANNCLSWNFDPFSFLSFSIVATEPRFSFRRFLKMFYLVRGVRGREIEYWAEWWKSSEEDTCLFLFLLYIYPLLSNYNRIIPIGRFIYHEDIINRDYLHRYEFIISN